MQLFTHDNVLVCLEPGRLTFEEMVKMAYSNIVSTINMAYANVSTRIRARTREGDSLLQLLSETVNYNNNNTTCLDSH